MPYYALRRKRRTYRKRSYSRKRKAPRRSKGYSRSRRTYRRKPSAKRRRVVGPFASLGNRIIPHQKIAQLKWMNPDQQQIAYPTPIISGGVYTGQPFDCASPAFQADQNETIDGGAFKYIANNWDQFSVKYMRAQVQKAKYTFEFYGDSQLSGLALSNQVMFGVYLSDKFFVPLLGNIGNFEDLKKSGNLMYKKVNQFDRPTKIVCDVNTIACLQSSQAVDRMVTVKPFQKYENSAEDIKSAYPAERHLYVYPFVVQLSDPLGGNLSTLSYSFRVSCVKTVKFDRPIQNFFDVRSLDQYPAYKSALPETFQPRPLYPAGTLDDSKNIEQDARLEDLEDGQNVQDAAVQFGFANTATALQINTDAIDDVADDLAAHEAEQFPNVH